MTNYENLKQMNSDELTETLCDMIYEYGRCQANKICLMVSDLKQMSSDELAVTICDMMGECDKCPGIGMCRTGCGRANGLKEWMKQEVEE